MNNFIGSDVINGFSIGDENNKIVKGEIYQICHFPGSLSIRRLTFSDKIVFKQENEDVVEFINESGDIVYKFEIKENEETVEKFITVNVPATELSVQSLSLRWNKNGGSVSANFSGNIFVYEVENMVSLG